MKRVYFLALILFMRACINNTEALASGPVPEVEKDSLPVPEGIKELMFYVQRDPNANTVVYELNRTAQGTLDEKEPVHAFWIRYADEGEHKELNYVQRKFAYGLNATKLDKDTYELKFACYSKLSLFLRRNTDGKYHIYTRINQQEAIVDRVFVRIEGGSFWVPNVLYVELKGRDAATGTIITERFKP